MKSITQNWDVLWARYAQSAESNPAQEYRRKLIFSHLALDDHEGPIRLLDIGSGQGDFCAQVKARYPRVEILGIDLSESGVAIARRKVGEATFIQRDLTRLEPPPLPFQAWATHAVCSEMLEHVDDPHQVLRHVLPYLAPECRLVLTVPGGPMSDFDRHIGHRVHFTSLTLREMVEKAGFEIETASRAGFPFMNLYRLTVIARGKSLIHDVARRPDGRLPLPVSLMTGLFRSLFRLNRDDFAFGWQLVAVVRRNKKTGLRRGEPVSLT